MGKRTTPTVKAEEKADGHGQASKRTGKAASAEWRGYVRYERPKALLPQFEAWCEDGAMVTESMDTAASMGFKFSQAYNPEDDSFRAQWFSSDASRTDAGLALSAFGGTMWDAMLAATFFLSVMGGYSLDGSYFHAPSVKPVRSFWGAD